MPEIYANSTDICGPTKCFKTELPEFITMEKEQCSTNLTGPIRAYPGSSSRVNPIQLHCCDPTEDEWMDTGETLTMSSKRKNVFLVVEILPILQSSSCHFLSWHPSLFTN